jgi:Cellulase (glycosyl hydrolase family 5)
MPSPDRDEPAAPEVPEGDGERADGGFRPFLLRVLAGAVAAPVLVLIVLAVASIDLTDEAPKPAKPPPFRVEGNRIVGPGGHRFVVKGVTMPYGTFAGGDANGLGTENFGHVKRDLLAVRRLGVNTIKVLVTPRPADRAQMPRLRTVITEARRRGLVVIIGAAFTNFRAARDLARDLAHEYRGDPYVWLQPLNEPNCPIGRPEPRCFDWVLWQRQQTTIIRTIRKQGMTAPIVVNTPAYSSDLSRIDTYPLGDDALVWGVHRFANVKVKFAATDRVDERRSWADRTLTRAVIVDQVGSRAASEFAPLTPWVAGFLDFTTDWVRNSEGSGAIGFVWRWYDDNTMTNRAGKLTTWGRVFVEHYLRQVPGRA